MNRGSAKEMIMDVDGACKDWQRALDLGVKDAKKYILYDCKY